MELLPSFIDVVGREPFNFFCLKIHKHSIGNIKYIISYECDSMSGEDIIHNNFFATSLIRNDDFNLTNALASMLVQLIDNGYYKVIPVKNISLSINE